MKHNIEGLAVTKKCAQCGAEFVCDPVHHVYKRITNKGCVRLMCSWHCLRAWDLEKDGTPLQQAERHVKRCRKRLEKLEAKLYEDAFIYGNAAYKKRCMDASRKQREIIEDAEMLLEQRRREALDHGNAQ